MVLYLIVFKKPFLIVLILLAGNILDTKFFSACGALQEIFWSCMALSFF